MSDLRIQYDEEMVGADHPTKEDTLNRLMLAEHDSAGLHQRATLLVQEDDPDTEADQAALYAKESGGLAELFFRGADSGTVVQLTQGGKLNAVAYGLITGLVPRYVSGTALGFGGGTLNIGGALYTLSSAFSNLDCSGLIANTWYYVNVSIPSSGFALSVSQFSVESSAPAWSDTLGYWKETGGKRCVFAFKTSSSGSIEVFRTDGRTFWFNQNALTILNSSSPATSATTLAVGLPALGALKWYGNAWVNQSNSATYWIFMTSTNVSAGGVVGIAKQNAPGDYLTPFTMMSDDAGNVAYRTTWGGSGNLGLYLRGFDLPTGMAR